MCTFLSVCGCEETDDASLALLQMSSYFKDCATFFKQGHMLFDSLRSNNEGIFGLDPTAAPASSPAPRKASSATAKSVAVTSSTTTTTTTTTSSSTTAVAAAEPLKSYVLPGSVCFVRSSVVDGQAGPLADVNRRVQLGRVERFR